MKSEDEKNRPKETEKIESKTKTRKATGETMMCWKT